jgi:hypothetical protein
MVTVFLKLLEKKSLEYPSDSQSICLSLQAMIHGFEALFSDFELGNDLMMLLCLGTMGSTYLLLLILQV